MKANERVPSIKWENENLFILDQTKLPGEVHIEQQITLEQIWDSIRQLKVRGAPAIGVAGAYGLVVAMQQKQHMKREEFLRDLLESAQYLDTSRPTAVNLSWALKRIVDRADAAGASNGRDLYREIKDEAEKIHEEDIRLCRSIGEHGVELIREGYGILTHCNAGRLATSEYGTATAPMYLAHKRGVSFRVYSDESRPLLQGARLTAWELMEAGIDVTTITDGMAAFVMSQGLIDMVIVGTDRVAANGDVANKIGTLGVAILARHYNIPFYVACPASTVDLSTDKGSDIVIEERPESEVTEFASRRVAPDGIKVRNPAFDVTPHHLVSALISDRGIIYPPYAERLKENFG